MADPIASLAQNPWTLLLPPWRLGSNVRNTKDEVVESFSDGAIAVEWLFAAIVIMGVIGELRWPVVGDWVVAGGIVGEVLASMGAHLCQGELTRRSNERVAQLEFDVGLMEASAAKANERAAQLQWEVSEANARALEAKLALEKYKAPRRFSADQESRILAAASKYPRQKFSGKIASSVPDARQLWVRLSKTLTAAGWELVPPKGLAVGNPPAGVPIAPYQGITLYVPHGEMASIGQAASALMVAINGVKYPRSDDDGLDTVTGADAGEFAQAGVIAIEIGTKN